MGCRRILNSPLPMVTSNLQLPMEQFPLKEIELYLNNSYVPGKQEKNKTTKNSHQNE